MPVPNATEFTATSNGGGTWQNPGIWSISPSGGQGFPDNTGGDTYRVTINGNPSYNLNADVTITSLNVASGMTFQNAANRNFTVVGDFISTSGTLVTASAVTLFFNGDSEVNSRMDLRNGARLLNNGNMVVGPLGAGFHDQDFALPSAQGFSLVNNGTVVGDRPGTTTFRNFSILNTGTIEVRQGTFQAEGFTQTNATAHIRVLTGAELRANALTFNGGTVVASGSTLNGSSFTFRNSTLIIGEGIGDISSLTLAGNAAGDAGQDATFRFSLAGTAAGQFDTLAIVNGMNFNGLTLDIETLNGFEPTETDVFRIITGNNLSNGNFANATGNLLDVPDVGTFTITRNNQFVELGNFIPIPEPSMPALLAAGAAVLGLRRRQAR
ncbi:MAG: PEP-CTERM sorting domain-containing protein [Limisphaerales bacterium]